MLRKKQLLKKIKKYLFPWLIFFIGQTWVIGMDAILRLRKPMEFQGYFAEQTKDYSVARFGFPEGSLLFLIYLVVLYSLYLLINSMEFKIWNLLNWAQKLKKGLIFAVSLILGALINLYLLFDYAIYTGIDSL